MNIYEKQDLLMEAVKEAEARIGGYIAQEGTSREDAYVQTQLSKIISWNQALDDLYNTPISEED